MNIILYIVDLNGHKFTYLYATGVILFKINILALIDLSFNTLEENALFFGFLKAVCYALQHGECDQISQILIT